jgi:hypothetical protein
MIVNNEEVFMKVGDVSVSLRRSKMNTFLYYRLKPN